MLGSSSGELFPPPSLEGWEECGGSTRLEHQVASDLSWAPACGSGSLPAAVRDYSVQVTCLFQFPPLLLLLGLFFLICWGGGVFIVYLPELKNQVPDVLIATQI